MKNEMNKIPTPETTFRYEADKYTGGFSAYENMRDNAIDLERRLAACRELLASLDPYPDEEIEPARYGVYCEMTTTEIIAIRETLTLTAPKS